MPLAICVLALAIPVCTFQVDGPRPHVLDDRLELDLIAAEPDLVTPTGLAILPDGDILVIESHTHFRPENYAGPTTDRILRFHETSEGEHQRSIFYEGTVHTMNLGVHPNGGVYVATRSEVFRLDDSDNDGQADRRTPIAMLKTAGDYPHNGLSGFAFDWNGDLFFGLGENLGAGYELVGTDGSAHRGGGEGGSIFRIRPDGSNLSLEATGFWNPFHLCFDAFGRLFAVDNDPDSRPPCRLIHVVRGGDYGYRFRNGRKGLHPFTAWNGELPGTLPMVAGTGEAPSGILAYESDQLPSDYRGVLLGTSWGDHRIEAFRLAPKGASWQAVAKTVVHGGENFRPVGIAQGLDGSLYISDWVDKSYTLHGKGALWRLRSKEPRARVIPADPAAALSHADDRVRARGAASLLATGESGVQALNQAVTTGRDTRARIVALSTLLNAKKIKPAAPTKLVADPDEAFASFAIRALPANWFNPLSVAKSNHAPTVKAAALRRISDPMAEDFLLRELADLDPFIRQAARTGLLQSVSTPRLMELAHDPRPVVRMASLLLLRQLDTAETQAAIATFLNDRDPDIRFATIQWISDAHLTSYRKDVAEQLKLPRTTKGHFAACLAALSRLDQSTDAAVADVPAFVYALPLLADPETPPSLAAQALRIIPPDHDSLTPERLDRWLESTDAGLRREAIRSLRGSSHPQRLARLIALAQDESASPDDRAEAIVGLAEFHHEASVTELLLTLAAGDAPSLADEALRSLRQASLTLEQEEVLAQVAATHQNRAELARAVFAPAELVARPRLDDEAAWLELLEGDADPIAGERVFFHPRGPGCYRCHAMDGRGGNLGPELSRLSTPRVDRRRLLTSILRPSLEIAPRFVPWTIALTNGEVKTGLLVEEWVNGDQTYADSEGRAFRLMPSEIAERAPGTRSIMPEELAHRMTLQEFRDLLAFLTSDAP